MHYSLDFLSEDISGHIRITLLRGNEDWDEDWDDGEDKESEEEESEEEENDGEESDGDKSEEESFDASAILG